MTRTLPLFFNGIGSWWRWSLILKSYAVKYLLTLTPEGLNEKVVISVHFILITSTSNIFDRWSNTLFDTTAVEIGHSWKCDLSVKFYPEDRFWRRGQYETFNRQGNNELWFIICFKSMCWLIKLCIEALLIYKLHDLQYRVFFPLILLYRVSPNDLYCVSKKY